MKAITSRRVVKIRLKEFRHEDGAVLYQAEVDPWGASPVQRLTYGMECEVSDLPREMAVLMERIIKDLKGWI